MLQKTVFVGLSGGVDSSVSAALLKEQGYKVVGVFIKIWRPELLFSTHMNSGLPACTEREDRLDAMRVCANLDIDFKTLDLSVVYKKEVVDYMIAEYRAGRTPNPDVLCNKYVKFGAFFDWATKNGADYVATGHYAKIKEKKLKNKIHYQLLAGSDNNKDQSYFLWTLTQKQLAKTLFPVGHLVKPTVRRLAKKFGLATAEKKDSQGICFIGQVEMKDFLANFVPNEPGPVLNEQGQVIGRHRGAAFFTIGERHGFEITKKTPNDQPYYVIDKDMAQKTLVVSQNPKKVSTPQMKIVRLKDANWINDAPDKNKKYQVRTRYRQTLMPAQIKKIGQKYEIHFEQVPPAISVGQSAVVYDGEICLGGGIIN